MTSSLSQPSNDEEPDVTTNTLLCKSGHATMILNASLLVADQDTESADLVFTLTAIPETGSLVKFTREVSDDVMRKLKETGNGRFEENAFFVYVCVCLCVCMFRPIRPLAPGTSNFRLSPC